MFRILNCAHFSVFIFLLFESINIEYLIIQWLKPVLRYINPQNTRNYDAIQVINPQIFSIVLKFFSWSLNLNLLSIPYVIHPLDLYCLLHIPSLVIKKQSHYSTSYKKSINMNNYIFFYLIKSIIICLKRVDCVA